jgi:hypothetical protein
LNFVFFFFQFIRPFPFFTFFVCFLLKQLKKIKKAGHVGGVGWGWDFGVQGSISLFYFFLSDPLSLSDRKHDNKSQGEIFFFSTFQLLSLELGTAE